MKKPALFVLFTCFLFLTACGPQPQSEITASSVAVPASGTVASSYAYTWKMLQPSVIDMTNRTAMNEGFHEQRTTGYVLSTGEVDRRKAECPEITILTEGLSTPKDSPSLATVLSSSKLVAGATIPLTGYWNAKSMINLSDTEKQQVATRGRTIVGIDRLNSRYPISYAKEDSSDMAYSEEWATIYDKIGGSTEENRRYPFNTMLITNDLLLHIYHKLFDNGLKYYEEQIARPTLTTLSETLYQQYLTASQQEKNPELQSFYAFLAAYWAVPHIFLPSNDQLIALSQQAMNRARENNDYDSSPNIGDEALATFLQQRMQTITSTLPAPYQTLLPQIVEKILKADEPKAMDEFLAVLAEDELLQNGMQLQQDYTQFRPRAHYTDSSLLKTYFMAMKWLMREKFYFQSPTLTKAALILGSTIDEQDLQKLNQLSQQISQLIGTDDDLTLNELLQWQATKNFTTPSTMLANFNEQLRTELASLHPQNIQSTAYSTDTVMMTTETEAKQATDGFVFFGEKFTLDSYLFDLTTAGSAEKEFAYKPNIQTALIVPDILEDNALAHQLVKLRLSEKADENKIREDAASGFTQYSSYEKVKEEAKAALSALRNKEGPETSPIVNNIYHNWLSLLGLLVKAPLENAPYFQLDPLYQLKNLITYLGSYTELKHDTLLYVKQAYAELGAGGGEPCVIEIPNPALPVPKGYLDVQPNFLDQLIQLNAKTAQYFDETYEQEKFVEFGNILQKFKEMLLKQLHNEIISDEDFEWLRLLASYQGTLSKLLLPTKTIGEPTQKEMRGALIADIFTSEGGNPLYEAIGRPALMVLMVNDVNGARVVLGPVFTHYEFYQSDEIIPSDSATRYTDEDRQDLLHSESRGEEYYQYYPEMGEFQPALNSQQGLSIVSKEFLSELLIEDLLPLWQ